MKILFGLIPTLSSKIGKKNIAHHGIRIHDPEMNDQESCVLPTALAEVTKSAPTSNGYKVLKMS